MLVGARAPEHEVGVAVDQARRDPGAAERDDFAGTEAGKLGALADPDDLAVRDADRAILNHAKAVAFERRNVAVDE